MSSVSEQVPISITKVSCGGGVPLIYLCRELRKRTGIRKGDRVMLCLVEKEPGCFLVKKLDELPQKKER